MALERSWLETTLRQGLVTEFPQIKDQAQAVNVGSEDNSGRAEDNTDSHHPVSASPVKKQQPERDNDQTPEPPEPPGEPVDELEEGPYFSLLIEGKTFRVARNQLDPARRGQEAASGIYAYLPESLSVTWPLTELEQMAGVPPALRLPDTDQKPLNYLATYGTEETRQALQDFYPVDSLQLTQDNHLEEAGSLTSEQLGGNCIICQDSMLRYRGAVRTDCQHVFHLPCLIAYFDKQLPEQGRDESLEVNLKCPMCRRKQTQLGQLLVNQGLLSQELLHASGWGQESVVRVLLEARVSSDAVDSQGYTALHKAALANNLGIAVLLISGGANVDEVDSEGLTAIDLASMSGHRPMVEALTEAIGTSPVFYWAAYGVSDEIERWIDSGENLEDTRDSEGSTLLHIAAARGHTEIVNQLLSYAENLGLKVIDCLNSHHQTPLCVACDNGETAVVRLLLSCGASPNPRSAADSPLFLGARKGRLEIVQLLLEEQSGHYQDVERIQALVAAAQHGHHETVKALMTGIHTPLAQWGEQALIEAAGQGYWRVVGMLLDAGVTGLVTLKKALGFAVDNGHVNTVHLLLERGAVNFSDDSALASTLLLKSAQANQSEMVRLLIKHGAPIDRSRKGDGATALILATDHGWLAVVKALLEHGANVNLATKWYLAQRFTPL